MPIDPSPHGAEILHQPPQPQYPEPKPGQEDVEDEEADPVIDSGPGIDNDGLKSLRKQRG